MKCCCSHVISWRLKNYDFEEKKQKQKKKNIIRVYLQKKFRFVYYSLNFALLVIKCAQMLSLKPCFRGEH